MMPSPSSTWLITPLRPSSTTHAKVRTRKAGPEGEQHPEQQAVLAITRQRGNQVSNRVPGEHGEEGRPQGNLQRDQQYIHIHRRSKEPLVFDERKAAAVMHAQQQQLADGVHEHHEQQHDDRRAHRAGSQPCAPSGRGVAAVRRDAFVQRSGRNDSSLTPQWPQRPRSATKARASARFRTGGRAGWWETPRRAAGRR
jgi:hypothetical protein